MHRFDYLLFGSLHPVLPNEGYQRVVEMSHIKVSCSLAKVRLTPTVHKDSDHTVKIAIIH